MNPSKSTSKTSPGANYKYQSSMGEGLKMTIHKIRLDEPQTKTTRDKTGPSDKPRKIRSENEDKENVQSSEDPCRLNVPQKDNSHPSGASVDPRVLNETQKASLQVPRMTGLHPLNVPQSEVGFLECTTGTNLAVHNSEMNPRTITSEISPGTAYEANYRKDVRSLEAEHGYRLIRISDEEYFLEPLLDKSPNGQHSSPD